MGKRGRPKKEGGPNKQFIETLGAEVVQDLEAAAPDELHKKMLNYQLLLDASKLQQKQDPDVLKAKEDLERLVSPYKDQQRAAALGASFCAKLLHEKGFGSAETEDED